MEFLAKSNLVIGYFIGCNILLFIQMGIDKGLAICRKRRIPEKFLLSLGFLGGGFGGVFAMIIFRHKIRKPYFIGIYVFNILLWLFYYLFIGQCLFFFIKELEVK